MDNRNLDPRSEKSIFAHRQANESSCPDTLFVKCSKTYEPNAPFKPCETSFFGAAAPSQYKAINAHCIPRIAYAIEFLPCKGSRPIARNMPCSSRRGACLMQSCAQNPMWKILRKKCAFKFCHDISLQAPHKKPMP